MMSAGRAFAFAACQPNESGVRVLKQCQSGSDHYQRTPAAADPGPAAAAPTSSADFSPGTNPPVFIGTSDVVVSLEAHAPRNMAADQMTKLRRNKLFMAEK